MQHRILAALSILVFTSSAHAQVNPSAGMGPALPLPELGERPLGITLSGGVSLGAYEAGYLYYVIEQLRRIHVRPRVLTGTSAGSINAFIGLLESCSDAPAGPTDSLLYRLWVPMGLEQLYDASGVTDSSIFSRRGFETPIGLVRQVWNRGLDADCDVRLGTAVTRATPRQIPVGGGGATIPRMTEHFMLRVHGNGRGTPPTVENVRTKEQGRTLSLLPVDGPDAKPFDAILDALLASSGFPLAFPPQAVHTCSVRARDGVAPVCTPDRTEAVSFIDGGLFDNRPIGLAYSALREVAGDGVRPALLFVDPNLRTWPLPDSETQHKRGVFALVTGALFDFIDTAMAAELERLITHEPGLEEDLFLGNVHFPPASAPMGAFLGFIDGELRRFDFYLGMFNARRFTAGVLGVATANLRDTSGAPDEPSLRPLRCLRALWDRDGDPAQACAGDDLVDFRILAQVAGEQVVNDCLRNGRGRHSPHRLCIAAYSGVGPPKVVGVTQHGDFCIRRREADYEWTMRRLGELGFWFRDLGLRRDQSTRGLLELRHVLGQIVDKLAHKQGALSLAYQILGTFAMNQVKYAPSEHIVHVVIGDRLEAGWSWTRPTSAMRWARLSVALALRGLDTIFSSRPAYFGLAPMAGIELEPLPLSRPSIQTRLALRGGYLFSTEDQFLRRGCDVNADSPCSRPLGEAVLSVSLLSALRIQLAATWMPPVRPGEKHEWALAPSFGLQLPFVSR